MRTPVSLSELRAVQAYHHAPVNAAAPWLA